MPSLWDRASGVFQRATAQFSPRHHFVRDYRRLVADLIRVCGHDLAMDLGVGGGGFKEQGQLEFDLLRFLGLKEGDFIMDVGCGSGRLPAALAASGIAVKYHGTDVVPAFLKHAKSISPKHFQYTRVDQIKIPERDERADFVTFFSVATHLQLFETYNYLQEARRVAKPSGVMVVSFLELGNPTHWQIFQNITEDDWHLNTFFEPSMLQIIADHLGLAIENLFPAGASFIPSEGGLKSFGQSIAVLRKSADGASQSRR
jgi:ubiquinone/menaquinone biosynthesis C-methylase UbiE